MAGRDYRSTIMTDPNEILSDYYGNKRAPLPDGVVPADDDDGLTCNCSPKRGWKGKLPVPVDGNNWPLDFAAKMLDCSEKDLRDLVRILRVEPAGTMKMAAYRRSGRHPRVYDASTLVRMWEKFCDLAADIENL
jgi:hypothetical protein